jgi:predicted O-linked N-acetylglucosamine transferase (SPINDLY family)
MTALDPLRTALDLLRNHRPAEAEALLRRHVATHPTDPKAHAALARTLGALARFDEAEVAASHALALDPDSPAALLEATALARRRGDLARAEPLLERLIARAPLPALRLDHARLVLDRGDEARARTLLEALLAQHPDFIDAWIALGDLHARAQRHDDALTAHRRALTLDETRIAAHEGAARVLLALKADGRLWIEHRQRVAELDPTPVTWTRYAIDCGRIARFDLVREAYERAIALDPRYLPARWGAFLMPREMVHPDEASLARYAQEFREGLAFFEGIERFTEWEARDCLTQATNFYLHYLGEAFVEEQRRFGRILERMAAALPPLAPAERPRGDERIRLGIVSGHLRRHTMTKLFGAMLATLPRERFEISMFYLGDVVDAQTDALREASDHFLHGERNLDFWRQSLAERDLDVLLHVDIGMHPMAQALAPHRFAAYQCALWGHPVTTGLSTIDAFLSSDAMEADDGARNYTETLLRLPGLGCTFEAPSLEPVVPPSIADGKDRIEFLFVQAAMKILPLHDELFARIAREVPQARFHFTPHPQSPVRRRLRERISAAFARQGLDFDRHCGTFGWISEAEFLGLASRAHVNLDSIGWSGGNTTLEITAFDVPTVTMPRPLMRSRHTYAILRTLGLDELIARDVDAYVALAVRLARDTPWREQLRTRIRERKHLLYGRNDAVTAAFAEFLSRAAR